MNRAPATLLLIRHGETVWNAQRRIQGCRDIPLSAAGRWQAGRLAERLAGERIDAIYSSDLSRAWRTAEPVAARLGLELRADSRLRERRFGIFEGHTLDEIAARWPAEFAAWCERDPAWAMPDGESGAEFIARVTAALSDIACAWAGSTVAVIAHGGVLDVAYRTARGLPWNAPREHARVNAAINRIRAAAPPLRLDIVEWGDAAHLEQARDEVAT